MNTLQEAMKSAWQSFSAKVVCDSLSPENVRLTTLEVVFPRIILAEFNTHRVFSRNSASSRAIPTEKLLDQVIKNPFVPIYWGKNQPGMQAHESLSPEEQAQAISVWLAARTDAVDAAGRLLELGVHKQILNRIIEPYMWHTVVVTSTEWDNFFALRQPGGDSIDPSFAAQPEMQVAAMAMLDAVELSTPVYVAEGHWHLPYVDQKTMEFLAESDQMDLAVKISVARCARVSYARQSEQREIDEDVALYDRLLSSGHMSPFEHPARPGAKGSWYGNFHGWEQHRKMIPNEDNYAKAAAK